MTRRVGNIVLLVAESPQQCDLCGKIEELRPYGPKGEAVCFECGMKDEPAAKSAFDRLINEDDCIETPNA